MTTNVRDGRAGVLATDSRWSVDLRPYGKPMVYFQDDPQYQKIIEVKGKVYMFAGMTKLIQAWKQGVALASLYPNVVEFDALPVGDLAVCIVYEGGNPIQEFGPRRALRESTFAGTGSQFAENCWDINQDALKAVDTAKKSDFRTGGQVRYYNYRTKEHNLGEDKGLSLLQAGFRTKGRIMYTDRLHEVSIAEAAANDSSLHEIIDRVDSGSLLASAPTGADEPWSEDERKRLVEAMRQIFPRS